MMDDIDSFLGASNPQDFAKVYGEAAERAGKKLGVDPKIILGQWGIETGWGRNIIPGTNNLGNIKDFSGSGVEAKDNQTGTTDKYLKFKNLDEFADHYADLIKNKYKGAVGAGEDSAKFANALKQGGYAENHDYAQKIVQAHGMVPELEKKPVVASMEDIDAFLGEQTKPEEKKEPTWYEKLRGVPLGQKLPDDPAHAGLAQRARIVDAGKEAFTKPGILNNPAVGGVENALNVGTGLGSSLVGGVAGLGSLAKTGIANQWNKGLHIPTEEERIAAYAKAGDLVKGIQQDYTYQPKTGFGKLFNEATGVPLNALSEATRAVGGDVGAAVGNRAAGEEIGGALPQVVPILKGGAGMMKGANAPKTVTQADPNLIAARNQGYVVPPAMAKTPGPLDNFFQGAVGDVKTEQAASMKNATTLSGKIKAEFKIPDHEPLSVDAIEDVREKAGDAYKAVKKAVPTLKATPTYQAALADPISRFKQAKKDFPEYFKSDEIDSKMAALNKPSFSTEGAIDMQKKLRADGYANLKSFDDPAKQALGEAQLSAAKAIDALIDENLQAAAPPGVKNFKSKLVDNLNEARRTIAKTYSVQSAMNPATGMVSSAKLARMWEKGEPLSGALLDAAKAQKAFPKAFQNVENIQGKAQVSNLDLAKATLLGATGHGVAGALSVAARPAIKPLIFSDWYQDTLTKPQISSNAGPIAAGAIPMSLLIQQAQQKGNQQ